MIRLLASLWHRLCGRVVCDSCGAHCRDGDQAYALRWAPTGAIVGLLGVRVVWSCLGCRKLPVVLGQAKREAW